MGGGPARPHRDGLEQIHGEVTVPQTAIFPLAEYIPVEPTGPGQPILLSSPHPDPLIQPDGRVHPAFLVLPAIHPPPPAERAQHAHLPQADNRAALIPDGLLPDPLPIALIVPDEAELQSRVELLLHLQL